MPDSDYSVSVQSPASPASPSESADQLHPLPLQLQNKHTNVHAHTHNHTHTHANAHSSSSHSNLYPYPFPMPAQDRSTVVPVPVAPHERDRVRQSAIHSLVLRQNSLEDLTPEILSIIESTAAPSPVAVCVAQSAGDRPDSSSASPERPSLNFSKEDINSSGSQRPRQGSLSAQLKNRNSVSTPTRTQIGRRSYIHYQSASHGTLDFSSFSVAMQEGEESSASGTSSTHLPLSSCSSSLAVHSSHPSHSESHSTPLALPIRISVYIPLIEDSIRFEAPSRSTALQILQFALQCYRSEHTRDPNPVMLKEVTQYKLHVAEEDDEEQIDEDIPALLESAEVRSTGSTHFVLMPVKRESAESSTKRGTGHSKANSMSNSKPNSRPHSHSSSREFKDADWELVGKGDNLHTIDGIESQSQQERDNQSQSNKDKAKKEKRGSLSVLKGFFCLKKENPAKKAQKHASQDGNEPGKAPETVNASQSEAQS